MQQAAAAQQLRIPVQVKQVSRGSMWPAMVLSFLTAIFAWIWYRGSGKAENEPGAVRGSVETKPVHPETETGAVPAHLETEPSAVRGSVETKPVHPETEPSPVRGSVETKPVPSEREGGLTAGAAAVKVTKGGLQAAPPKPPKNVPTREEEAQDHLPAQAGIPQDFLPQTLTGAPMVAELSQQTKAEDGCQPNSHEVKVTPNGVPEARDLHHEEQECPPLMNEVEAPPAGDEAVRPPSMSGEHGAHKLPQDPVEAGQREELLSWRNGGQDEVNGNAAGSQLENSFDAKEKAVGLLKAKENLNQDLYLEMVNTLDEAGSDTRVDQMMKPEEVEKCELVSLMSPICLQDSAALGDEMMSDAQKLGTGPESSPVDTCNLVNQEKEIAGLGNSSTDDKTALDKSSETSIQDLDNQKTRKIATIQPMPQNVNIALKVHYITQSDAQVIAVTGDHEKLGKWEAYVPLTSGKDGFWSHLITLPVDTNLAWKLVMVENGKIKRWEECNNRFLKTTHEDIAIQLCWGLP